MKWSKSSKRIGRRYQLQIKKAKRIAFAILFLLFLFAIYRLQLNFKLFKKPEAIQSQEESLPVSIFLSYTEPTLLPEIPPINQINQFTSTVSAQNYNLLSSGKLTPGKDTAQVNLLFSEKPTQEKLKKTSQLITKINSQIPILAGYLINDTFYFTGTNLPDIIVSLKVSEQELSLSLQSIPSLAKIKEGIKIIDLRFNHPIIK